jgi:hypothetical protein
MTDYPSLPEQGKNLAKFAFDVLKNAMKTGALFVSEEVKEERLAICRGCEHYNQKQVRCKECGCFLDQKASLALDSCPIGKWAESDTDWMNGGYDYVLDSLNQSPRPDGPTFPLQPKVGDVYSWNDSTWIWNGQLWDIQS